MSISLSRALFGCVLFGALLATGLHAQAAPINLLPPLEPEDEETLKTDAPKERQSQEEKSQQIHLLSSQDCVLVGLGDTHSAALEKDVWKTSEGRRLWESVVALPEESTSVVMRELMRPLLVSFTFPPEGLSCGAFLYTRLGKLYDSAQQEAAHTLLSGFFWFLSLSDLVEISIELALEERHFSEACRLAEDFGPQGKRIFYTRVALICALVKGDTRHAQEIVETAQWQGIPDVTLFEILDRNPRLPKEIDQTLWVLYTQLEIPFPQDAVAVLRGSLLSRVAQDKTLDMTTRLLAAERGVRLGGVEPTVLSALYKEAISLPLPEASADMHQRLSLNAQLLESRSQEEQVALLESISADFGPESYPTLVLATQERWRAIRPSTDLSAFAPHAVRAFFTLGDTERMLAWLEVLEQTVPPPAFPPSPFPSPYMLEENTLTPLEAYLEEGWPQRLVRDFAWLLRPQAPPSQITLSRDNITPSSATQEELLPVLRVARLVDIAYMLLDSPAKTLLQDTDNTTDRAQESRARVARLLKAHRAFGPLGPAGSSPETLQEIVEEFIHASDYETARRLVAEALLAHVLSPY